MRDAVVLNAGAALAVYGAVVEDVGQALSEGMLLATQAIDSGAAKDVLERWIAASSAA